MRRMGAKASARARFFWPMHEQPVFRKMGLFAGISCPVAERIARRGFYLPSGVALTRAIRPSRSPRRSKRCWYEHMPQLIRVEFARRTTRRE